MAAPPWPANVPLSFLHGTYQEAMPDGRLRTEMDTGPAKLRRRTTAAPRPMAGTIHIDGTQLTILVNFWTMTTYYGTLAFTFTHPYFGNTVLARFVEAPRWRTVGADYQVELSLEVLP